MRQQRPTTTSVLFLIVLVLSGMVGCSPVRATPRPSPAATAPVEPSLVPPAPTRLPSPRPTATPTPQPTPPGLILYESSYATTTGERKRAIRQMDGDGSDKQIVVAEEEVYGSPEFPTWSPDGRYFAYRWAYTQDLRTWWESIWVADREDAWHRQVTEPAECTGWEWWSETALVLTTGSGEGCDPRSPHFREGFHRFLYDIVTEEVGPFPLPEEYYRGYQEFRCSPGGCAKVAGIKNGGRDYFILDRATGVTVTVFTLPKEKRGDVEAAEEGTWSPDGQYLAFSHTCWQEEVRELFSDLYIVRANGQGLRRLTYFETAYQGRGSMLGMARLTWSPDGRWLAGTLGISGESLGFLAVLSVESGEVINLGIGWRGGTQPVWSPDSRHLAFTTNARFESGHFPNSYGDLDQWDIYIVDIYTREVLRLTDDRAMEMQINWR